MLLFRRVHHVTDIHPPGNAEPLPTFGVLVSSYPPATGTAKRATSCQGENAHDAQPNAGPIHTRRQQHVDRQRCIQPSLEATSPGSVDSRATG